MSNVAQSDGEIQVESLETGQPVSESALQAMGGSINYLLSNAAPLGTIISSMLNEVTFQGQTNTTWILADGRDVTGSDYANLTGNTSVPDLRAVFLRGKDNGRGLNPLGDLPLGTYSPDQTGPHTHSLTTSQVFRPNNYFPGTGLSAWDESGPGVSQGITPWTGYESAPKSVTINFFIKINIIA